MKPKFKAGDRVVAVISGDNYTLEVGMTGTVVDYDQTIFESWPIATILFDHNNEKGTWHDYRFDLIEKTEIKA